MGEVALLDAAYCYRCRIAVVRSVCLSRVGLVFTHESCAIAGIEIPTFQGLSGPSKSNGVLCVGLVFKLLSKTAEPDVSRLGEHICVGPKTMYQIWFISTYEKGTFEGNVYPAPLTR